MPCERNWPRSNGGVLRDVSRIVTPPPRTVAQGPMSMWTPCDGREVAVPVFEREAAVGARQQLRLDLDGTGIDGC